MRNIKTKLLILVLVAVALAGVILLSGCGPGVPKQNFAHLTAKKFTLWYGGALYHSDLDMDSNKIDLDADADTSVEADTDDQIDIEISGSDDFRFTANKFKVLEGSVIEADTINETTSGSGVTVDSVVLKDGGLTATGDVVVSGYVRVASVTAISVTNGCTITPTGTYQPLESAGTVGCGDIVTGTAGDRLVLINTADTSITISDTGSLKLGSNRVLAQYDSLELWSDGTYWIELGYAENASGTTTFSNLATTDLTTTDDVLVGDDLEVADFFQLQCGSVYTVTNGEDMMAASTYQELQAAAWVTVCLGTMNATEGDVQIWMNTCSEKITLQESGADSAMAGDFVMEQYDSIMLIYDGALWIELCRSDN